MAHQTFFKSDMKTRLDEATEAERAADRLWRDLCRYIDTRDSMRCRCCRRRVVKTLKKQADRLERHHVIPKSVGGPETRENLALLCNECHELRHVKRTLHISGSAEKRRGLRFELGKQVWRG